MSVPASPRALSGSDEAKRLLALILEALSGLRTTQQAADAIGTSQVRYYQLETRALQAMLEALEPQKRGRKRSLDKELEQARDEIQRLRREVQRYQALHRSVQRAVGVKEAVKKSAPKGKVRRPRKKLRVQRVVEALGKPDKVPAAKLPAREGKESGP